MTPCIIILRLDQLHSSVHSCAHACNLREACVHVHIHSHTHMRACIVCTPRRSVTGARDFLPDRSMPRARIDVHALACIDCCLVYTSHRHTRHTPHARMHGTSYVHACSSRTAVRTHACASTTYRTHRSIDHLLCHGRHACVYITTNVSYTHG